MKNSTLYQALTYNMLSVVVLSVFMFRSYAFVEHTPGYPIILYILVPILLAVVARQILDFFVLRKSALVKQPRLQFLIDFGLYSVIAFSLFFSEWYLHTQSLMIALKMLVLTLMIGYFASVDSALGRESLVYQAARFHDSMSNVSSLSVAQRLNLFFSVTLLIAIFVCGLFAYSYMSMDADMSRVKEEFVIDMLFIVSIFISLTVRLIYAYSTNLHSQFDVHVKGLQKIQEGQLDQFVPVLSQDEFGMMAQQTNKLIEQLREKRKIQKTLEEIVSPDIMERLLTGDSQKLKEGQELEVAVLFCDLRKFTTYAENTPSEEVIFFLNAYFTKVADIVAEHHGIVNKFMGDAILAVYGVDSDPNYITDAMNTAWDILQHSEVVKTRNGTTFDIGIGVHRGLATACTIGSAERYEYTFIGDTVNTASRLDSMSKELGYRLITSAEVYQDLDPETQQRFTDLGSQTIRGKSSALHIYGANPKKKTYGDNIVQLPGRRA